MRHRNALNFAILALVALAIVLLPAGGNALDVALTVLSMAFFAALVLFGVRLHREHRFELDTLSDLERAVLYGSIGLAALTFTGTQRLFDAGGLGVIAWIALLALASYGAYWVWTRYRAYG
ncbi:MAG: hypothetical protein IRZ21_08585 [Thermoleophilaceae bacterium]|nr:hypothetical protein [Thermoleophilaceae bacterium]